jgi:hypothetical protein
MKTLIALVLGLLSLSISAEPLTDTYDKVGTVISFDASERKVTIDYQEYNLAEDIEIIGTTRRGEYGDELIAGQNVGFSVGLSLEGNLIINQLTVIKNDKNTQ